MPLRLTIDTPFGSIDNAFARVLEIDIIRGQRKVELRGAIWINTTASGDERDPVRRFHYTVSGQDYNQYFTIPALSPAGVTPDSKAEAYLMTLPEFAGAIQV